MTEFDVWRERAGDACRAFGCLLELQPGHDAWRARAVRPDGTRFADAWGVGRVAAMRALVEYLSLMDAPQPEEVGR